MISSNFARRLQEEDLLFLPLDITRQDVVAEWVRNIEAGQTFTVLAYDEQTLAGYGSLNRQPTQWSRHLGEIRLNVGPGYRGTGLGFLLADEILDVARHSSLRKIIAQMPRDQEAARAQTPPDPGTPQRLRAGWLHCGRVPHSTGPGLDRHRHRTRRTNSSSTRPERPVASR